MKDKKGISLIVLILTIIVMTILASAIIISLADNKIIDRAKEAVDTTNLQEIQNLAQLGWADAYIDGARTVEELQAGVNKALLANKINPEDYIIIVTTKGVSVKTGWIREGDYIVKGNQKLKIGDTINYDEGVDSKKRTWKLLNVDDNGDLLIVSGVGSVDLAGETIEEAQYNWINGVSLLNDVCKPFGKGKGALGARSITAEDLNRLMGNNVETDSNYSQEIVYKYNKTTSPSFSISGGESGTINLINNKFVYYNGSEFITVTEEELVSLENNGREIAKLINNYYEITIKQSDSNSNSDIDYNYTGIYNFLNTSYMESYWLANPVFHGETGSYGIMVISGGEARCESGTPVCYQDGASCDVHTLLDIHGEGLRRHRNIEVRAVVTLSQNCEFTGSSETGWSYTVK